MDRERILQLLRDDLNAARQRCAAASERFDEILRGTLRGIPHPDGTKLLSRASSQYRRAIEEGMEAFARLNNYLTHGTVPPDLEAKPKPLDKKAG